MLKSDFTKKLIEQFKTALKEITELKEQNNMNGALIAIQNTFSNLFRLNSMFFDSVSDENLVEILKVNGVIEKDKTIIIAKLLEEEASIYEKIGNEKDSFYLYLKSLNLMLEAFFCDREAELTYYFSDIDTLYNTISSFVIPNNIKNKLLRYYEEVKNYATAENILYDLLESCNYSDDSINQGIEFYTRLLAKDDTDLIEGNLPRDEIKEALNSLKKQL